MATIRTYTTTYCRKKPIPMLLPDLWVTHDETIRNGRRTVKPYYYNLRTRKTFYSKRALYRHFRSMAAQDSSTRERNEEENNQICSTCDETGHNSTTCPYPVIHTMNPLAGKRIRRCSRCHWLGHNVRTCRQAV